MTGEEAEILRDLWRFSVSERYTEEEIRKALAKAIEALKEPLIYCKDCKYYKTPERYSYTDNNLYCCRSALMKMNENDFCSKGERKEGEEK